MLNKSSIVSVIVVNHNRRDFLKSCLNSIDSQSYKPLETIVIDNVSSDGSIEMIEKEFPQVVLISNRTNLYFSAAYNKGIDVSKGEFVLCVNNDIILDKNFIKYLVEKKDLNTKIGILGGKILRMDKETVDTAGQFIGKDRKPLERGYGEKDDGQFDKEEYVFGICGAAVLFRKEMLNTIKVSGEYFDEDFESFYEDLDLNWRANRFGWKAYYVPEALAYHRRGGTAQINMPKLKFLRRFHICYLPIRLQANLARNRYLMIIKNDKLKDYLNNFDFILTYDIMLLTYILLFRQTVILELLKSKHKFKKAFLKRKRIINNLINNKQHNDL